jgi:hypothetical protein
VRWDRFFADLEGQLDSEWEAERAALDSEAERLRISRLALRDRLRALAAAGCEVVVDLQEGEPLRGALWAVGADWIGAAGPSGERVLIPLGAVAAVGAALPDVLLSTRPEASGPRDVAERMGLGFVLRDLARRRSPVAVRLRGDRTLEGTIDRAGADHADVARHGADAPRRADAVGGFVLVPFGAILAIRLPGTSIRAGQSG